MTSDAIAAVTVGYVAVEELERLAQDLSVFLIRALAGHVDAIEVLELSNAAARATGEARRLRDSLPAYFPHRWPDERSGWVPMTIASQRPSHEGSA